MLTPFRMVLLAGLLVCLNLPRASAGAAPVSIAGSIFYFSYFTDSTSASYMVLFSTDGTFQELQAGAQAFGNTVPVMLTGGTFTYTVSANDPDVGTITVPGRAFPSGTINFAGGYSDLGTFQYFPSVAQSGPVNVSTRSWVTAAHPMEVGFVIEGGKGKWVLVRGAGPSLAQFGVSGALARPQVTVLQNGNSLHTVTSWSSDPTLVPGYNALFALVGAFPFASGSADCAGLMFLPPGAYVAQGTTNGTEGEILTEVYILPLGDASF